MISVGDDALPLELEIDAEERTSTIGDPVFVTATIHSRSERAITLNGRFLINHFYAHPDERELTVNVQGPPGYVTLKDFHISALPPKADEFVWLGPGESFSRVLNLTDYETLHLPGSYVVHMEYSSAVKTIVFGNEAWTGTLSSNHLTLHRRP